MADGATVRERDTRAIANLVGECGELGTDPYAWTFHLCSGLRSLIGCQVATAGMSRAPAAEMSMSDLLGVIDMGWSEPWHREHCQRFWMNMGWRQDLIFQAQVQMPGAVSAVRPQDAGDNASWLRSPPLNEYYRIAEQEEMMSGACAPPDVSGLRLLFINILRPRGDPRFAVRDREIMAGVMRALRGHLGVRLRPFGAPSPPGITPRLRQIMVLLLRGHTEKEVASELGLSPHTVHGHVKNLHRQLQIHSRKELLTVIRSLLTPDLSPSMASLDGRLREVLERVAQGKTDRQIASELGISSHTVHDYLKALYRRTGVHGRGQLLFWCSMHDCHQVNDGQRPN